jgi:hypothetical protein
MIDFIFAGVAYVGVMFAVLYSIFLATVGICYGVAQIFRRCTRRSHQPTLVMK